MRDSSAGRVQQLVVHLILTTQQTYLYYHILCVATIMDAAYLQREVGGALAKGLAAVTSAQPLDPVGFLGQWLLQYVHNQAHAKEVLTTI